ncbi:Smr/MutS family protein [Pelagerythrobacter marensis]|uniref:Smr/MutS family protein n=1 Tax=Pelagerythrobacter marensis TaxID=543877 RepID=A0ABZ2D980_9SPHN
MSAPRGLSEAEKAAWQRLAATVTPLAGRKTPPPLGEVAARSADGGGKQSAPSRPRPAPSTARDASGPPPPKGEDAGLDSHWERRFRAGSVAPDFTLDLHGHTLDAAHARLESGLFQAKAMGARVVLLIAGKPRPVDAADRGNRRGAIRAKILDWLAAGPHGSDIAAIRKAHRRHGGEGALYLVLKRRR